MLRSHPGIAENYHRRFRHVLVDEYQDTNHAQYALVRELVGDGADGVEPAELTVVGDSDQSIYAFRGASIRNIEEFEQDGISGAKLPLDSVDPGCRERGHLQEQRTTPQATVDGGRCGRKGHPGCCGQ